MYDAFDAAHRRDHVDMVIEQSMEIAHGLDVSYDRQSAALSKELASYGSQTVPMQHAWKRLET